MIKGSCHCRATQFEVVAAPTTVTSCNCSICSKRGALWAYYTPEQFRLTTARDRVSTYQCSAYILEMHFCGVCGCGTYNEGPDWNENGLDLTRRKIGVNARLFDDFDLDAVEVVRVNGKADW